MYFLLVVVSLVISKRCSVTELNMTLSCRREAARHYVSLENLISQSRSIKVIRNDTAQYGACKFLLVFHTVSMSMQLLFAPSLQEGFEKYTYKRF